MSRIEVQGGRQREFQVRLDPRALAGRQLTPNDVVDALSKDHQILSAGLVERNHELYLALVDGREGGVDALEELAIPVPDGVPARLADLGTVASADAVSFIRTTADGEEAVLVNVVQQPSANTVAIEAGISKLLRSHPELIPAGVHWGNFYDQAKFIRDSVHGVRDAILIGVGLAALVLLLFLRRWKLTLVAALAIPATVALVLLGLGVSGQSVNLMTLGGIAAALGLVADDAIVMVENIHRHEETGPVAPAGADRHPRAAARPGRLEPLDDRRLPPVRAAPRGRRRLLQAARPDHGPGARRLLGHRRLRAAGSDGEARDKRDRAATRRRRRAGARSGRGGRGDARRGGGRPAAPGRWTRKLVGWWPLAALVVVVLGGGAYLLYRTIDTDFLPAMDEGSIILDYRTPAGTSLSETDLMLGHAEEVIQSLPDVAGYSRRTGTELGFFVTEPNSGDYTIKLKPRGERRPVDEVIDALRTRIAAVEPAIETDFGQLLEDQIGDLTGGVPQPIEIKLFGEDQAQLQETARKVADLVAKVQGVEDVFDGIIIAGPALDLRVRPLELARHDLTTEDLQVQVEAGLLGTVATDLRFGERVYDVRVLTEHPGALGLLPILGPDGTMTRLSDLATIATGPPEAEIDREDLRTYLGVTARLTGRSLGSAVSSIQQRLGRQLSLPAGVSIVYGGLYAQQQSSFKALLGVLFAGLVLVAVILLFEFGDWRAPLLTAIIALAVLPGVFGALVLTGQTLNISSFVGAIMMVGIVGENAIFVIHEGRLELERGLAVRDAWAVAARRRLRPVAMTILATACALAPLALALGEGSQLLQPLAIAVIGGFVLSGPLVLWVLPSLYARLDPHGRLARRPVAVRDA